MGPMAGIDEIPRTLGVVVKGEKGQITRSLGYESSEQKVEAHTKLMEFLELGCDIEITNEGGTPCLTNE